MCVLNLGAPHLFALHLFAPGSCLTSLGVALTSSTTTSTWLTGPIVTLLVKAYRYVCHLPEHSSLACAHCPASRTSLRLVRGRPVRKCTRTCLFMPHVPEATAAMYTCGVAVTMAMDLAGVGALAEAEADSVPVALLLRLGLLPAS